MPVTLGRILSRRPRDREQGDEWIGKSSLPATTLSMGTREGEWSPETVPLPPVADQGLAVVLKECLVARCDDQWGAGAAAYWEVSACQEDSELVPGIGVHVDPHPPCLLCGPCVSGNHLHCIQSARRDRGPGWIARDMVLSAWSANRGLLEVPASASGLSRLFGYPLARARHALAGVQKGGFGNVAVLGADLPGLLAGLVLERTVPGSTRCLVDSCQARLEAAERWGYHAAVRSVADIGSRGAGAPDLVVVATDRADALGEALEICATGGTILLATAGSDDGPRDKVDWREVWRRELTIRSGRGLSPDDLRTAMSWLPDLRTRLESVPVVRIPFEEASRARGLLASDPHLAGVVLVA